MKPVLPYEPKNILLKTDTTPRPSRLYVYATRTPAYNSKTTDILPTKYPNARPSTTVVVVVDIIPKNASVQLIYVFERAI